MTNQDNICKTSTLVAIDISMQRHEVLVQPPGRKRYRMSITNDRVRASSSSRTTTIRR
ncbi:MAG TPA: hypothetical protein VLA11_03780 [Woeseiaceae bacterium]|jgi:hypothetical protein|nr:hypothetical protein [Woeseiaceae bacterium]